ncbi:MAG TPA: hypothetical protein VLM87_06055, partial [Rubrivivax sp.]|nr:hypothetical protein [Rubrivivax sp.]
MDSGAGDHSADMASQAKSTTAGTVVGWFQNAAPSRRACSAIAQPSVAANQIVYARPTVRNGAPASAHAAAARQASSR